jgi:hypothetical protein
MTIITKFDDTQKEKSSEEVFPSNTDPVILNQDWVKATKRARLALTIIWLTCLGLGIASTICALQIDIPYMIGINIVVPLLGICSVILILCMHSVSKGHHVLLPSFAVVSTVHVISSALLLVSCVIRLIKAYEWIQGPFKLYGYTTGFCEVNIVWLGLAGAIANGRICIKSLNLILKSPKGNEQDDGQRSCPESANAHTLQLAIFNVIASHLLLLFGIIATATWELKLSCVICSDVSLFAFYSVVGSRLLKFVRALSGVVCSLLFVALIVRTCIDTVTCFSVVVLFCGIATMSLSIPSMIASVKLIQFNHLKVDIVAWVRNHIEVVGIEAVSAAETALTTNAAETETTHAAETATINAAEPPVSGSANDVFKVSYTANSEAVTMEYEGEHPGHKVLDEETSSAAPASAVDRVESSPDPAVDSSPPSSLPPAP